jgi:uncharacterized protein YbaA (DUF1428 family)
MARYVDGFVLAVPKGKLAAYRRMAVKASRIWKEYGAQEYFECALEDKKTGFGIPFPRLARSRPGEIVFFSFIVYRSRAHRDRVNAKVMKDPRIAAMCDPADTPFDVKRMAYGGFEVLVEA